MVDIAMFRPRFRFVQDSFTHATSVTFARSDMPLHAGCSIASAAALRSDDGRRWIPAFAGMTIGEGVLLEELIVSAQAGSRCARMRDD